MSRANGRRGRGGRQSRPERGPAQSTKTAIPGYFAFYSFDDQSDLERMIEDKFKDMAEYTYFVTYNLFPIIPANGNFHTSCVLLSVLERPGKLCVVFNDVDTNQECTALLHFDGKELRFNKLSKPVATLPIYRVDISSSMNGERPYVVVHFNDETERKTLMAEGGAKNNDSQFLSALERFEKMQVEAFEKMASVIAQSLNPAVSTPEQPAQIKVDMNETFVPAPNSDEEADKSSIAAVEEPKHATLTVYKSEPFKFGDVEVDGAPMLKRSNNLFHYYIPKNGNDEERPAMIATLGLNTEFKPDRLIIPEHSVITRGDPITDINHEHFLQNLVMVGSSGVAEPEMSVQLDLMVPTVTLSKTTHKKSNAKTLINGKWVPVLLEKLRC